MRWGRGLLAMAALLATLGQPVALGAQQRQPVRRPAQVRKRPPQPPPLVYHVERLDGTVVASHRADELVNPASVVKVGTSLWALERLGPEFRFETRVFVRGEVDHVQRRVIGDLLVRGGQDPDFHLENAFLIADGLNALGIETVTGVLAVDRSFWIGWENGSAGAVSAPEQRGERMAARLRQAMDPQRWNNQVRTTWNQFSQRRGWDERTPPRVAILGGLAVDDESRSPNLVLVHRSQPLWHTIQRFNCFSNNDIERFSEVLGPVDSLAELLAVRCGVGSESIQLSTTSGLGTNRMSPRIMVRLMREFRATASRVEIPMTGLLPVAGCDPGTVTRFYPRLALGEAMASLVGKTGTLTSTDGGVSVLAGFLNTAAGELVFTVAAPRAGGRLAAARQAEERWLLALLESHGGGRPYQCSAPPGAADRDAGILLLQASQP